MNCLLTVGIDNHENIDINFREEKVLRIEAETLENLSVA